MRLPGQEGGCGVTALQEKQNRAILFASNCLLAEQVLCLPGNGELELGTSTDRPGYRGSRIAGQLRSNCVQMAKDKVKIMNPVEGSSRFTTRNAANRYVQRGQARWADLGKQWIIFSDRDANRAIISQCRLQESLGIDAICRKMTRGEMAAIPVLQATRLTVDTSKTPRRAPVWRRGPVVRRDELLVSAG
jgi:hypothetical protein